jgi:hypothetical protein
MNNPRLNEDLPNNRTTTGFRISEAKHYSGSQES